jgi:ribosomal protein L11 methyltransferase
MLPYENLYIYEISGTLSQSRRFFQKDFIGCWNEGEISFLFFSAPHDEEVRNVVRRKRLTLASRNVLDYQAWQAGEELKPFKAGNLVFSPPWEEVIVGSGESLIRLDPCVVFGTGYHPTTRACLQALCRIYEVEKPRVALDLGTGSGILALAAARWGAEKVLAVDANELAADTALRNVALNGESERIEVKQGRAENFVEEEADLVCANLHYDVIASLLAKTAFYRKRWFILSGFFVRDASEIERLWRERSVQVYDRLQTKNWMTLVGLNHLWQQ